MKYPVVLDLETQHSFREFEKAKDLKVSVVGLYDFATKQSRTFLESELSKLFLLLEHASYTIGFNIRSFDMQVLQPYYAGDVASFSILDICDEVKEKIGRRLSLNDLAFATLGTKKSGHGLMAIELFKEDKWDELKKYCLDDVIVTKQLFGYGVANEKIHYLSEKGKETIRVDWKKYLQDSNPQDMALTLPF